MAFKVPGECSGVLIGSVHAMSCVLGCPMGEAVLPLFGGRLWQYWALLQPDLLLAFWPGSDSPGGGFFVLVGVDFGRSCSWSLSVPDLACVGAGLGLAGARFGVLCGLGEGG